MIGATPPFCPPRADVVLSSSHTVTVFKKARSFTRTRAIPEDAEMEPLAEVTVISDNQLVIDTLSMKSTGQARSIGMESTGLLSYGTFGLYNTFCTVLSDDSDRAKIESCSTDGLGKGYFLSHVVLRAKIEVQVRPPM
jgi:hypothetical protein